MKNLQEQQDDLRAETGKIESDITRMKRELANAVEDLVVSFTQLTGRAIVVESKTAFDSDGIIEMGTRAGNVHT